MNFIVSCVQQLDRAAAELDVSDPVANRLSLILSDNAVELLIHAQCNSIFSRHGAYPVDELTNRYGRAARHRVLGPHLDEKLKFLRAENMIIEMELGFIRIAHSIRNIAYHSGVGQEPFLYALAWEYHDLACSLFVRLGRGYISTGSSDLSASARFLRHMPTGAAAFTPPFVGGDQEKTEIAASLNRARPPLERPLSDALADWLITEIADIEDDLEYLVRNNPDGDEAGKVLADVLYSRELFDQVPASLEHGTEGFNAFILERKTRMGANWSPRFEQLPLVSWLGRAERLRTANRYAALAGFERLKSDYTPAKEALSEFADVLSGHLDSQLDAYMEDRAFRGQ